MNNNYFDDIRNQEDRRRKTSVPGWVWAIVIIGVVLSILWGYSAGTSAAMMTNLGTIEDKTPDSAKLGVLDFSESLYLFTQYDDYSMYNRIDYPGSALFYSSSRQSNKSGLYTNEYKMSAKFSVEFFNMNYYDVCCVFDPGEGYKGNLNYLFETELANGNMELKIVALSKNFTTEKNSDGYDVIKPEYIVDIKQIPGDKDASGVLDNDVYGKSGDVYYVFIIGAESASGSYELSVTSGASNK